MNRKVSIWTFTIVFQITFDSIVELKYNGYWYFDNGIDQLGFLAHTVLIPSINILLLSYFPFNASVFKKGNYIVCWTVVFMLYEKLISLPEPLGFFHLGWWKVWIDVIGALILILIMLGYYKWICNMEKKLLNSY